MSYKKQPSDPKTEDDAEGQYAPIQSGRDNDGTASANPRVLSGKNDGDATFPVKKIQPSDK